jgi:hypothetical protein
MTTPNLSRVVETFVPCCDSREAVRLWEAYFCFLRRTVSPIVRQLQRDAMVGWFSFLVHDCASGVPCPPEDTRFFIHLRLELLGEGRIADLDLPPTCLYTRIMPSVDERSLGSAHVSALVEPSVPNGWALLGLSSEWVLQLAERHKDNVSMPHQNVAQFLHYLGNQLLIRATTIPMP